ncbi:hypothetical protein DFP74_5143 [Nocardiopsis sp. Huas11]|uniref:hypothetical protein n=1 Tax=Nocardiopsis sp. Huas11 TaxID=2183912 RepID=UPI000EB2994D|nr:hypothetical protein [Nocardiopsis sp. Huas11]RKS09407.1 hypothetical protein DFP74_5143 [Nocardiopsis sp. Huas11]
MDRPDGRGTAREDRPDGDGEEAGGGDAAPTDLALCDDWAALFHRVFAVYAGRLWPLLVVASLPAVPITLLGQALLVAPARDGVYLNGAPETAIDPLATPYLVATGIAVLLGLAVAPVVLGGATLLGTAALLGRRISPRQAWRAALPRYFTTLTWILLLITLLVGSLAFFLWALSAEWEEVLTAVLVLGALIPLLTLLTVSLPLALVEGHGPFRALWEAARLARRRFGTHLLLVSLSYGVSVAAGTGLERALLRWTDLVEGGPVLLATTVLAGLLAAPLSLLLACAAVVYSGTAGPENPFATPRPARYDERGRLVSLPREQHRHADQGPVRALDLVRVGARLPEPAPDRSSGLGGPRAVVVPALVLAVFGAPLSGPALLAANPFGLPEMDSHPVVSVGGDELSVSMRPTDQGAMIGVAAGRVVDVQVCDPECRSVHEGSPGRHGNGVLVGDGGAQWTVWREYLHEDASPNDGARYAPHPDSGLYWMSCADVTDCETPDEEVQLRHFTGDHYDTASGITRLADGRLLVASSVRHDDDAGADPGGLRLYLCADTSCADPETVLFPPELTVGGFLTDGDFLTPAASPGGGYAMAVTDTVRGTLSVVACAEESCTDPEITEIRGERFYSEHESRLRGRFGARVEFRSDGTPVLAYREPQGGRARVVDCHDPLCAEFTDTAVTGPGWARPVPGLAVDSQDRVHVLTPDFVQERLVLLSCQDRSCARTSATPLEALTGAEPAVTVLALDGADRPHMLWGQGQSHASFSGWTDFDADARYLRCAEPLCGSRW